MGHWIIFVVDGYSLDNRSMLVYNPEAVWPETLSSAAMIKALHENNHNYMPDDDSSSTQKKAIVWSRLENF